MTFSNRAEYEGKALTLKTRTGLSLVRGSKMFNAPDIESDTRSFWPLQVLPICWWFTPDPTVHVVTAFWVWASPNQKKGQFRIQRNGRLSQPRILTKFDGTVSWWGEYWFAVRTPVASHLYSHNLQSQTKHTGWKSRKKKTYNAPFMRIIREFGHRVSCLAII